MDVGYRIRGTFDNDGDGAFRLPAPEPTAAERFAAWALPKLDAATTRKAIYGFIVVLGHRYFADVRKHPAEREALHRVYQQAFEALEERLLELDPALPDGEGQPVAPAAPPVAAGVLYQETEG